MVRRRPARGGLCALAGALSVACALPVAAQTYPTKPVRLVIPFPPGGPTDIVGRMVAQHLAETWKQQFIADNRPGAGGNIGVELASKAPPVRERVVHSLGAIPIGNTPEEFNAFLRADAAQWAKVAAAARVTLD